MSASPMSLSDFYEQVYLPQRHLASPSTTLASYRAQIRALQAFADTLPHRPRGPVMIHELTDELLSGAMRHKLSIEEREIPTANKLLRTISCIWRFAKRRGFTQLLPDLDRLKENKRDPEAWSLAEFAQILAAASQRKGRAPLPGKVGNVSAGVWWPACLGVIASTGVRISAVMTIEPKHVDLSRGEILIVADHQKQKTDQRFTLKPEICELIKALQPGRLQYLFGDWPYDWQRAAAGGGRWATLQRHYSEILRAAGLTDTRRDKFHKLRRTFATLIAAEAGEVVAQALLGHSTIAVTRRYLDPRYLDRPSAREILPSFTFTPPKPAA